MRNRNDIIFFDFETTGLDPVNNDAVQVAAKAYNGVTLEPYSVEENGEFKSYMKPLNFESISPKALEVNGLKLEQLHTFPDQKVVWNKFVDWVNTFNKKHSKWGTPLAGGKNIRNFDMKFVHELNKRHCQKKEDTLLFSNYLYLDLEDFMFAWFENSDELENHKIETIASYFGFSTEGLHDAMRDTVVSAIVITKFLKLHRNLKSKILFKDSCKTQ